MRSKDEPENVYATRDGREFRKARSHPNKRLGIMSLFDGSVLPELKRLNYNPCQEMLTLDCGKSFRVRVVSCGLY